MTKRNIEEIRRKNLEDNQFFLDQLRMNDIRNDFVNSARSILRGKENTKKPIEYEKIEYTTRYYRKVKSGEIPPHIPEWERKKQRKLLEKEQKQKLREERLKRQNEKRTSADSRWSAIYENNGNPYHRVFQPRATKIGERIEQELKESLKQDNS